MDIVIWTQTGCPLCARVKAGLRGRKFEERPAAALLAGRERDRAAMAQLAMQDMQLPLVRIDGCFISPLELLERAA